MVEAPLDSGSQPIEVEESTTIMDINEPGPSVPLQPDAQAGETTTLVEDAAPVLDAEFLCALGDKIDEVPTYGEKIHPVLAERWQPLLRSGMTRDVKEKLLKEYAIPENCKLLRAPSLNPQLLRPLTDATKGRDKKMEAAQQQLGLGMTAINRAMTILLTEEDKQSKVQAIKILSDGVRILSDLHFNETQARIKLITPSLDKTFLDTVQNVERDEFLFGSQLADKIKDSIAVEKQGWQIKKGAAVPKNKSYTPYPSTSQQATPRSRYQGNWVAPPRYQQPLPSPSRGGRTTGPRNIAPSSSNRRTAAPGPVQTRSSSHPKHRPAPRF